MPTIRAPLLNFSVRRQTLAWPPTTTHQAVGKVARQEYGTTLRKTFIFKFFFGIQVYTSHLNI
jgi:hypothetical protein